MTSSQLKTRRISLGMTTTQLAHRLGVSQSTIVRLESSESRKTVSIASLERAADALGCDLHYELRLRGDTPASTPQPTGARSSGRRFSPLEADLDTREVLLARESSAAQRLKRGIELSDFTRRLKCSNKSS